MKPRTRRYTTTLAVALVALLLLPSSAAATVPVYDYINWILAWYQRGVQIQHQYDQFKALKQQLESFGRQGDFDSLNGLLGDLDELFRSGENLGYILAGVEDVFAETFPGYEAPVLWPDEYALRLSRTRNTLQLITTALNRLTWANTHSQVMVERLQERSKTADSPLEELEVQTMWQNLAVSEQQRALQAQLLTANAVTVAAAAGLQREAAAEAARNAWLVGETAPDPGEDSGTGFTGIPDNWPWRL
jgi:hypothetical protein